MKNFQQNLLVVLAVCLCALCVHQWYGQTLQRNQIQTLNQMVNEKSLAIRDYTNSIATMNHQIMEMSGELAGLKATVKTNEQMEADQFRKISELQFTGEALTNQIAEYKKAVDTLNSRLKDAYAGIEKQNESLKQLVAQRDEFVQKYNDSVKERNDIVAKYNDLVAKIQKAQGGGDSGR